MELHIDDFTFPAREDAIELRAPRFEGEEDSGVSLATAPDATGPTTLTLTDTTVRFMPLFVTTMANPGYTLRVIPPCVESCASESLALCPSDHLCYAPGDEYCVRCAQREPVECACHGNGESLADGTACEYDNSIDTTLVASCSAGRCEGE